MHSSKRSFPSRLARNAAARRKEVGKRLRESRERMGKQADDVAYALGYTRSVLYRIETGFRKLDLIEAENLAVFYGFQLENLATWKSQFTDDQKKAQDGKLDSFMVLKADEFKAREEELREKRKQQRRKNRASVNGRSAETSESLKS